MAKENYSCSKRDAQHETSVGGIHVATQIGSYGKEDIYCAMLGDHVTDMGLSSRSLWAQERGWYRVVITSFIMHIYVSGLITLCTFM